MCAGDQGQHNKAQLTSTGKQDIMYGRPALEGLMHAMVQARLAQPRSRDSLCTAPALPHRRQRHLLPFASTARLQASCVPWCRRGSRPVAATRRRSCPWSSSRLHTQRARGARRRPRPRARPRCRGAARGRCGGTARWWVPGGLRRRGSRGAALRQGWRALARGRGGSRRCLWSGARWVGGRGPWAPRCRPGRNLRRGAAAIRGQAHSARVRGRLLGSVRARVRGV